MISQLWKLSADELELEVVISLLRTLKRTKAKIKANEQKS